MAARGITTGRKKQRTANIRAVSWFREKPHAENRMRLYERISDTHRERRMQTIKNPPKKWIKERVPLTRQAEQTLIVNAYLIGSKDIRTKYNKERGYWELWYTRPSYTGD